MYPTVVPKCMQDLTSISMHVVGKIGPDLRVFRVPRGSPEFRISFDLNPEIY